MVFTAALFFQNNRKKEKKLIYELGWIENKKIFDLSPFFVYPFSPINQKRVFEATISTSSEGRHESREHWYKSDDMLSLLCYLIYGKLIEKSRFRDKVRP